MERRRVVITGLGAVTPIGLTAGESWQAVKNGVCGIGPITHYDPAAQKVKLAAEVKGFDPEALLGRQESKRMGRFTQFAVAAARETLSDAGFSAEQADPDRCGVILSRGIGGQAITETERRRAIQEKYNEENGITPQTIRKDVAEILEISSHKEDGKKKKKRYTAAERQELIQKYTKEMKAAAKLLEFEHAAYLRDKIKELEGSGPLPGQKRRLPKP